MYISLSYIVIDLYLDGNVILYIFFYQNIIKKQEIVFILL
jgi:hypothetical protein